MARPREPINLLEAKARKHLTKVEIEERQENEVKAPSDRIKAPSYLTSELRREFNKIAKQLTDVGIMTNLDVDTLARFIIGRAMYITFKRRKRP
jgi:phage terminase small subunit